MIVSLIRCKGDKMTIDLNSKSHAANRINWFIDRGCQLLRSEEKQRNYLGCSAVGGPCERAVQYEALSTVYCGKVIQAPEIPSRVLRVFSRGHVVEDLAAGWMRSAGFLVNTKNESGRQFGVSFLDGRLLGHVDGIITFWFAKEECPVELPCLWECKCLHHKGVTGLRRNKLKNTYPKYYGQMQLYMGGLNLNRGVITCVDADTMEIYHEIVPFSEKEFKGLLERTEHVLDVCERGEMIPRFAVSPAEIMCKLCHWKDICWGDEND